MGLFKLCLNHPQGGGTDCRNVDTQILGGFGQNSLILNCFGQSGQNDDLVGGVCDWFFLTDLGR